jgi:Fe-S oxidoreductase
VHTRIPFDLVTEPGIATFRRFIERAAQLVASYGGSYSGEHGDGQSKAEFLPLLYGDRVVEAFERFKAIFDPGDRMNPGKIVTPYRIDENLRLGADWSPRSPKTFFSYPNDEGRFDRAVLRCVGVGKCRHDHGGVMCPSYMATREEEHSTRGRSRLLFEMLGGHADSPVSAGWHSTEVRDALDLCLACKGCKKDCPVEVDMATMKAEFMAHHYARRLRPRSHFSLGWLPVTARAAARAPRLANGLAQSSILHPFVAAAAGIDRRRTLPRFATVSLQEWFAHRTPGGDGHRGEVLLWPDTFTNFFTPEIGQSAVAVLEDAGWRVRLPDRSVCCGLTWISTGQLQTARRVLRRSRDVLSGDLRRGVPVVGLEPSCTAALRSDAPDLLGGDRDIERLSKQTMTFAELLSEHSPGWTPPRVDSQAIVQTHCHQHAVLGDEADRQLMRTAGMHAEVLDSGCCGLAGNFGFEAGHYEVSRKIGERVLLPAIREASPGTVVVADGFSCRTQIEQGETGRRALHLAQVLAAGLRT